MADEFREAGAHFERGVLLENGNDLNGARSAYEQAVAVDPRHVEAVASLAWLDAQAGNTASAAAFGERALDLDAENVLARMALASAGLQAGELEEAKQPTGKALRRSGTYGRQSLDRTRHGRRPERCLG